MSDSIPFDDFEALLDGRLDAAAAGRLKARLDADPALRAEFDAYREVHAFTAPAVGSAPSSSVSFERLDAARRAERARRLRPWLAAAATLLIAAAGVAAFVRSRPTVVELRAIDLDVALSARRIVDVPPALASYRPVRDGRLNWVASLDEGRALGRATGRRLFVWVYHPDCPMCVELDHGAMSDRGVQEEAAKFVPVRIDVMAASKEVHGWLRAGWPYLAAQTADGERLVEFAGEEDAAKIRAALASGEGGAKDALPWPVVNEVATLYARAEEARAAGRVADAYRGYEAVEERLAAAPRRDDVASAAFRGDADARLAELHVEARGAIEEAKKLAETDEAAGARRLTEAAERFRGTPYGLDLAVVEQALRATGRFPVLVEAAK